MSYLDIKLKASAENQKRHCSLIRKQRSVDAVQQNGAYIGANQVLNASEVLELSGSSIEELIHSENDINKLNAVKFQTFELRCVSNKYPRIRLFSI